MKSQEPRGYRSEGHAPAPRHRYCDNGGGQAFIGHQHFRRPDRSENRRRNVVQRAAQERRQRHPGRQEQKRSAQRERHQRHAEYGGPERHARRWKKRPAPMPQAAAATMLSRSGSPWKATTAAPAASAAAIVPRSRRNGTESAMKASGAANSSRQAGGTPAPTTTPASTAPCQTIHTITPAPRKYSTLPGSSGCSAKRVSSRP